MLNTVGKGSLERNQTTHVKKPYANKHNCSLL